MEQVKKSQPISLAEVKEILEKEDPEKMDQIQRWTHDYVTKFTKLDS
ncbi:MAG: RNA polymerase Rpb4, partial [Candidatus Nitrosotenuis sp.]